jgi:hypothetical protein
MTIPLRLFFCLLGHGPFHFVPCVPPFFLGALVYLWLAGFHRFEGTLERVHSSSLFWALLLFITFNKVIGKEENEENLGFWVKFEDGQKCQRKQKRIKLSFLFNSRLFQFPSISCVLHLSTCLASTLGPIYDMGYLRGLYKAYLNCLKI